MLAQLCTVLVEQYEKSGALAELEKGISTLGWQVDLSQRIIP
jgi:hypothetical protein